jgi:hypothetical protein
VEGEEGHRGRLAWWFRSVGKPADHRGQVLLKSIQLSWHQDSGYLSCDLLCHRLSFGVEKSQVAIRLRLPSMRWRGLHALRLHR